ncbi:MAG: carbamoyltransferase [Chthoniobacterales bacterium]
MSENVTIGIGGFLGHDGNAAILVDGKLITSMQEERLTRLKHDKAFPAMAIAECLRTAQLNAGDVTDVVFAEKPVQARLFHFTHRAGSAVTRVLGHLAPESTRGHYAIKARALFPAARFHYAWHHLSHVAGAFHTSPFEKAAFLCVDGKGEDYSASAGVIDGKDVQILWEHPYDNGLGMLYTLVTYYLGFLSFGSEYKVMGLAPYGKPVFADKLSKLFTADENGGMQLKFEAHFEWEMMMDLLPRIAEATGVPVRGPKDPLTEQHVDIAASLQAVFEQEVMKMARFVRKETGMENLLFCGGCAQNCVAAGKLRAEKIFNRVFNSPVGGDMGSGLGAAALLERERRGGDFKLEAKGFYLGGEPGPAPESARPYQVEVKGDLHDFIAGELAEGKIVAWVRGGMELGARALGARSILADPRQPGMQSRLNLAVKFRESFRPFAPAILAEKTGEWFDCAEESDYMNYTANLRPELRAKMPESFETLRERLDFPRCSIPSVVHVDFSARLQTIRQEVHPDFYRLLTRFHERTGVPILINTSFNVSGQPIVNSGTEAWDCFVNTDVDLLVVGDEVFRNPFEKTKEEKLQWLEQFAKSA